MSGPHFIRSLLGSRGTAVWPRSPIINCHFIMHVIALLGHYACLLLDLRANTGHTIHSLIHSSNRASQNLT